MHSERAKVHDNLCDNSLISAQARRNLLIFGSTYLGIGPETGGWNRKLSSDMSLPSHPSMCWALLAPCQDPIAGLE
jgi:hypothetical protein